MSSVTNDTTAQIKNCAGEERCCSNAKQSDLDCCENPKAGGRFTLEDRPPPSTTSTQAPQSSTNTPPEPSDKEPDNAGIIAGSVIGGVALILLSLGVWWFLRRRRRHKIPSTVPEGNKTNKDTVILDGNEVVEIGGANREIVESDSRELAAELYSRTDDRRVVHEMPT